MPYYLVLLTRTENAKPDEVSNPHEPFVDTMIQEKVVVLGGDFVGDVGGAEGGYLLNTDTRAETEAWVGKDPLVSSGAYTARIVEWDLVAVDPAAVEPSDIIKREDETSAG